jgi:hypothetical protein
MRWDKRVFIAVARVLQGAMEIQLGTRPMSVLTRVQWENIPLLG